MESLSKPGCKIKNQKDPYQFQCVFSNDQEDRRDYSVYFKGSDGRQDLMVRCAYNEGYECTVRREGLSVTEDYITVSETFSEENGSFDCWDGSPPLEKFPCFYSGTSIKPEMKYGTIENGSGTFLKPEDGTEDNNNEVIIGASLGVVIIILCLVIFFLLYKMYTSGKLPTRNKSEREKNSSIEDKPLGTPETRVDTNQNEESLGGDTVAPPFDTNQNEGSPDEDITAPLLDTKQNEKSLNGYTSKTQNCNQINEGHINWSQLVTASIPVNHNDANNELLNRLTNNHAEPNDWKRVEVIIRREAKLSEWDIRQFGEMMRSDASREIETQHGQLVLDARTDGKLKRVKSF